MTEPLARQTLQDHLHAKKLIEAEEIVVLAMQMVDVLEATHTRGTIYKEIRPENIFLAEEAEIRILNFAPAGPPESSGHSSETQGGPGRASTAGQQSPYPNQTVDAVAYMSPEQVLGKELDRRTDLYSLGVVLYEMSTGTLPFQRATAESVAEAILRELPVPPKELNPALPEELNRIILTLLSKYRELRFRSTRELRNELKALLPQQPIQSASVPGTSVTPASTVRPSAPESTQSKHGPPAAIVPEDARKPTVPVKEVPVKEALVLLAAFILVAGGWFFYQMHGDTLNEGNYVLVTDFANMTGDSVFDGTLKQALAVKLRESPFLNVVSEEQVHRTLHLMGRSPDETLKGPVAQEVCNRHEAKAVVEAEISSRGTRYRISLRTLDCESGDLLAVEENDASGKEEVLAALATAVFRLRRRLGEPALPAETFDDPIEDAATASLPAFQDYSFGERERIQNQKEQALRFYRNAIRLDPEFALAHARLGTIYNDLGKHELGSEHMKKAFDLSDRLSEFDRFRVSAQYFRDVLRDGTRQEATYELWKQLYPQDWLPRVRLAHQYSSSGQIERALEEAEQVLLLDPPHPAPYAAVGRLYIALNRFEEAKAIYEKIHARGLDHLSARVGLYLLAFTEGDRAAMERQIRWARGKPEEISMLAGEAAAQAFVGRLRRAKELYQQARNLARRDGLSTIARSLVAMEALVGGELGSYHPRLARSALAVGGDASAEALALFALARSGEVDRAERLAKKLAERFPRDTYLEAYVQPTIQAHIAIHRGDPARAIELLLAAEPYDLAISPDFPGLASIYVRGQAYMLAGETKQAVAEFQKILKHRGVDQVSPFYSLAHLRLARAYTAAGETEKSRQAYQDFLALWKDADSDIPLFQEAKADYARLH